MPFDPSSKGRLTGYDLDRFRGDTLFDRIGRAVCEAGCLPRKELYEAWEVARRARRLFRGGRVVDLAAGHGLLAHILLILDEVITGWGRLGKPFAAQYFGIEPDLITFAKGITSGSVPLGGVIAKDSIYQTFVDAPGGGMQFSHGYTYSGHPLACAAGIATLDTYAEEGLLEAPHAIQKQFEEGIHSLKGLPHVVDCRNLGLIGAVELEVSQPRQPCFKLGMRMGDADFVDLFDGAERFGCYLRIVRAGDVGAGDVIEVDPRPEGITVTELGVVGEDPPRALLDRILADPAMPESWRAWAQRRARRLD